MCPRKKKPMFVQCQMILFMDEKIEENQVFK